MTKIFQKKNFKVWLRISLVLFIVGCFVLPTYSHAAETPGNVIKTPLYELLRDDAALHRFWNDMLKLVNSFVVLLLIIVAFCEILNINISTYGVKKILPSLVFAVLAANFSWIMCRLFIDWANIAMSRFGSDTSIIDPLISSRAAFSINLQDINTPSTSGSLLGSEVTGPISFFQAGMKTLFVWVGAIALYVLTFLLLLRNVIIIALAVFSPIAFMAMVLPQTKSVFNKWWTTFMQWTFMPTVSVFMLWMGSKIQDSISGADPLIGFIIAVGFIYGAVRVPFSMSGAASGIMNKWADMGKKSAKFVGNAAYTASGAKATVDYQKELMKTRADVTKTKMANKLKDLTGIGSGIDIQKDKLARAQKRSKSISDKKVGDYIGHRGKGDKEGELTARQKRYAMEELETSANEGSTDFANKEFMSKISNVDPNSELGGKVRTMRTSAQKAIAQMEGFDKDWSAFNDEMKRNLFRGSNKEGEDIKKALESGVWKNGNAVTQEERTQAEAQFAFLRTYANSMLDGEIRGEESKKASNDVVDVAAEERLSIDNAAAQKEASAKLVKALADYNALRLTQATHTADEAKAFSEATNTLLTNGHGVDITDLTQDLTQINQDITDLDAAATKAVSSKVAQLRTQYGSTKAQIPIFLQNYLQFDNAGTLQGLQAMSNIERSRTAKKIGAKISGDKAAATENYGTAKKVAMLMHGDAVEGFDNSEIHNLFSGNSESNKADVNRKAIGIIESLKSDIREGGRVDHGNSGIATKGILEILKTHQDTTTGESESLTEMAKLINDSLGTNVVTGTSADDIHAQLTEIFSGNVLAGSAMHTAGLGTGDIARAKSAIAASIKSAQTLGGNRSTTNI